MQFHSILSIFLTCVMATSQAASILETGPVATYDKVQCTSGHFNPDPNKYYTMKVISGTYKHTSRHDNLRYEESLPVNTYYTDKGWPYYFREGSRAEQTTQIVQFQTDPTTRLAQWRFVPGTGTGNQFDIVNRETGMVMDIISDIWGGPTDIRDVEYSLIFGDRILTRAPYHEADGREDWPALAHHFDMPCVNWGGQMAVRIWMAEHVYHVVKIEEVEVFQKPVVQGTGDIVVNIANTNEAFGARDIMSMVGAIGSGIVTKVACGPVCGAVFGVGK